MKQHFIGWRAIWLAAALLGGGIVEAAALADPVRAADMQEDPAAVLRLAQKASRSCTDSCVAECRADRTGCKDGKNAEEDNQRCRTQFQICVRRCVISCSPK